MDEIELKKEIEKLFEIKKIIDRLELFLELSYQETAYCGQELERLKFACLKYNLLEMDEIENLTNLDKEQLAKFCIGLKSKITEDFINLIIK